MGSKFTLTKLAPEMAAVLDNTKIVTNAVNVQEAYFILQACQLTVTHPNLGIPMKDRFYALGRRMQELIRPHVSVFFSEFMEAGWHREYDEEAG